MLLTLEGDQELFRATTVKLLNELVPVEELRRRRDDPQGFGDDYWRRGADLGWTSLLVSEAHGGGSIGGDGLTDLAIVAYEFGRHAAPGPLAVVNVVAGTLSEIGGPQHEGVIDAIVSGTSIATWCLNEPRPNERIDQLAFDIHTEGDEVVLNGVKRPVESGGQAGSFLVTGRNGTGLTQVLVPADTPGLSVAPMDTVDLTRRFSVVTFDRVRLPRSALVGEEGQALEQMRRQLQWSVCLSSAEAVGAMQAAFDMTVEWAFDRYSFGRPLASYQELKHRFADMKMWLEAGHAISDAATQAVASQAADAPELVSAAKAFIGEFGGELIQDCVQIHGGIGVTFDHDIHLYLRRHTVNRALHGTASEHRQRLADLAQWPEEVA
jgi:alkylation response protein AidB-like acyl-CoA dehydrogenase